MITPWHRFDSHFKCSSRQSRWDLSVPRLLYSKAYALNFSYCRTRDTVPSHTCQQPPLYLATEREPVKSRESVEKWLCHPLFPLTHPLHRRPPLPRAVLPLQLPAKRCRPQEEAPRGCLTSQSQSVGGGPIWYQSANTNSCPVLEGEQTWWQNALNQSLPRLFFKYAPFRYLGCRFSYMEKRKLWIWVCAQRAD